MKIVVLLIVLMSAVSLHATETIKSASAPVEKKVQSCTDYAKFADTSMGEMKKIVREKNATIIDVNSEESFKDSAIPGAFHFAAYKDKLADKLPKDKSAMIVAYCGGKMCTAWQRAAKAACEMGYTNIRHFSEGISGWDKTKKKG